MSLGKSDNTVIGRMLSWVEAERPLRTALLVAAVAFLAYANSLGNGFVTDDPGVILHNPVLQGPPMALFSTIDTTGSSLLLPFYRPLAYLTFLAEGRLHGFDPFFMHLFNVVLHAANAVLVYLLARATVRGSAPALLAALLFAVHPISTESVNFLAGGRNTMLAAFFVLSACLAHRRSIARNAHVFSVVGACLFLAGLLSKESAMMALPFLGACELVAWWKAEARSLVPPLIRVVPYVAAATGYLVLRWMTLSRLGIQTNIIPGLGMHRLGELYLIPGLSERLLSNLYILPKYLASILWPTALSPRYMVPQDLHLLALPIVLGWLAIGGGLVWLTGKGRSGATVLGLSWAVAFWVPVSGLFLVSQILMADRYLYLPAIGLWIVAADQASRLRQQGSRIAKHVTVTALVVCFILTGLTIQRNREWKDEISLFSRMVEQYPENPYGYYHLGVALLKRRGPGDLQRAERHLEMVLALDPNTQSVQTPLGTIRLESGDPARAVVHYSEAIGSNPLDPEARLNRAIAFERLGRFEEALSDYRFYLSYPGRSPVPGSLEYVASRIRQLSMQQPSAPGTRNR